MLSLIEVEVIHGQIIAKANVYKSVNDMAARAIGQAKFNEMFGGIPEWIRASPDSEFTFVGINPILFN